ncbi:putative inactive purple acid phosphatase 1, partial [Morella rubra]
CIVSTCSGSITFHVVNIRTDIEFVFFTGEFATPCILTTTSPLSFANPNMPLYGHLSSVDSSETSMRLTWVSGDDAPQQVQYGDGMSQTSVVTTFTQADMCSEFLRPMTVYVFASLDKRNNFRSTSSPAADFWWHDPGFIHTAVMTGLQPSSIFSYSYGRYSPCGSLLMHPIIKVLHIESIDLDNEFD